MKKIISLITCALLIANVASAFTVNFVVSLGNGSFKLEDNTSTNGIAVSVVTFNSFTPVAGTTTFQEILDNSTVLASGTTVQDFLGNDGTIAINQSDITGQSGAELYVFANYLDGTQFGLWRDITGGTNWVGGDNDNLTTVTLSPADSISAFAGTFDNGMFILEAGTVPIPEPSTYFMMGLGGLALAFVYRRRR